MINLSSPRRLKAAPAALARQFALAVVLAAGTAVLTVPGLTGAAYAQKKKKDQEAAAEAAKPVYTPAFVKAYQPLDAKIKVPGADIAALKPEIQALASLAATADDQLALGGMIFNAGINGKDIALQLQGAETILASGKIKPEETGRYNLIAFQLANEIKDYGKARSYLQKAIDLNYATPTVTVADLQMNMAELFFTEDRNEEGIDYLIDIIGAKKAAGDPVDARIYRRGIAIAYSKEIVPQVYDIVERWVADYPTPENWRDAVNLTRNLNDFDGPVLLDLLRLGKKVGALKEKNDYIFYVESADQRRLPQEVKAVIEDAYTTGVIPKGSDSWIEEQYKSANSLVAADKGALASLERDANAATAKLRTVMAAGDTFLSYGDYAKAVGFYEKSLTLADADRDTSLTRLGIAQIGAGNGDAAIATFKQVSGARAPIARLWTAYVEQQMKSAMTAGATGN